MDWSSFATVPKADSLPCPSSREPSGWSFFWLKTPSTTRKARKKITHQKLNSCSQVTSTSLYSTFATLHLPASPLARKNLLLTRPVIMWSSFCIRLHKGCGKLQKSWFNLSQAYDEWAIERIYWQAHRRRMDRDEQGRIYAILTRLCANFNLISFTIKQAENCLPIPDTIYLTWTQLLSFFSHFRVKQQITDLTFWELT